MNPMRMTLSALLCIVCVLFTSARTRYATHHNQFSGLGDHVTLTPSQSISQNGERLIIDNATTSPLLIRDTTLCHQESVHYMVRMASLNNKPGKNYVAIDNVTGQKQKMENPVWGITFGTPSNNYIVIMKCHNSSLHDDLMDERSLSIDVCHQQNGSSVTTLQQISLNETDDIDLYDGLNALSIHIDDGMVKLLVGKHYLHEITQLKTDFDEDKLDVGLYIGPAAKIAVERTVVTINNDPHMNIMTHWTKDALSSHFSASVDPIEGFWTYLDRDVDDKILRMGGRYTIALVANDRKGYDIIYLDGAQVLRNQWKCGMLKGKLQPTMFGGIYDGLWIDATMLPIDEDVQANIDNGVVLTLRFPVYNSQLRFAKITNLDEF